MAKQRARWAILFVVLVLLSFLGVRQILRAVPELLRKAEETIAKEGRALGLKVSFRNPRFHFLPLRVSLDNLVVEDAMADRPLLRADSVALSLSPRGMILGGSPVSRVRVRTFSVRVGEENRPLLERIRSVRDGETGKQQIPEILLLDGSVDAGPIGPLQRWTAHVPQFLIRDTRFQGMQIGGSFDRSVARVVLAGDGSGEVPVESGAISLSLRKGIIRIRDLRLSGPAVSLRGSGLVDPRDRSATLKASGHGDIEKWIRSGGAGGASLAGIATRGQLDFTVSWTGNLERPAGSGKLTVSGLRLPGDIPVDGELSATLSDRLLRIDSLRGRLWGGTLEGKGELDWKRWEGRGTLSLNRAMLGNAPWKRWGVAWRPAGPGTVKLDVAGSREQVRCAIVLDNPGGLEKDGNNPARVFLPIEGTVDLVLLPGREITGQRFRLLAGKAEVSGTGRYRLSDRGIRVSGRIEVPGGRASLYGWDYPLSWGLLQGGGELTGTIDRLHMKGEFTARDLVARSLPPLSATMKFEGDPGKAIHFVVDCPANVANVTATGTLAGPLSPSPFLLDASVIAREIDASRGGPWVVAVLRSLGKDSADIERHAAGMSGTGSANVQISMGGGDAAVSGTLVSDEIRAFGVVARTVSFSGGWGRHGTDISWKMRASGELGDGNFLVTGRGDGGEGELFGNMEKVDLGWALSLLGRDPAGNIGGKADLTVAARNGSRGWNIGRLSIFVPRLSVRHAVPGAKADGGHPSVALDNVLAEGSLGERSGEIRVTAVSPRMTIRADISRQPDWPVSVSVAADNVTTAFFLGVAGRPDIPASGSWSVEGEGVVRAGPLIAKQEPWSEALTRLAFAATAASPAVSEVSFRELKVSGRKEGDTLRGEIETRGPDSRIAGFLSLLDPFRFRVEGPFSLLRSKVAGPGERNGGGNGSGLARFALEGTIEATGSLIHPESTTGSLAVRRLSYREGRVDFAGEEISLRFDPAGVRWVGGSLRAGGNPVQVSGKVSWGGDLDFRIEGNVPAAAARLATDIFDRLDGMVLVNLRVTGRWDDPSFVGTGRLKRGTLSFHGYAQIFEEMNADLVLSRERIVIEDFEGRSGGGYLDGRGEIPLRFDEKQRLFFSVDFFDMRYPYPEDLHPVLQGHVELFGPPDDLLISGDVEVQSALYTKTIRLEKAVMDFRRRQADVTARRKESDFRIRLDIDAVADETIRIKNNLGELLAKGEFKVAGDTGRVIILGSFEGIEGTVDFRGSRFQVTRLSVDFQDPLRNNPRIDASAETKKGNVNVIVSVTGTLEKYEVEFVSDPPLSKNDIFSLLSHGVKAEELGGAEGSVSAAEAASIALSPYTGSVEEGIRGIAGLDKFSVEPAFSSTDKSFGPRVTVGKSFGERFSVSVSTGVGASAESSASAELQVLENVFLQGSWKSATEDNKGDIGGDVRIRYRYRQFQDIFYERD